MTFTRFPITVSSVLNFWDPRKTIIYQLDRTQQVTIFRLRTGHCQLLSHLVRLKISHTDE